MIDALNKQITSTEIDINELKKKKGGCCG